MSGPGFLEVERLTVDYRGEGRRRRGITTAVDGATFALERGRTLGLVGESGSGKSSIGNAILGLVEPSAGTITFCGEDITFAPSRRRRELSKHIQAVFQDPYSSLNPSRTIGETLAEPLRVARRHSRRTAIAAAAGMLRRVGIAEDAARRYPREFSGGQRQRIAIARALVVGPELIVCDEPTSALDLSVQAQILNLLLDLQNQLHLSYLFISHDIDVVRHMAHRAAVLSQGKIVEEGPALQITEAPRHAYTRRLLAAVPDPDPATFARRRKPQLRDVSRPADRRHSAPASGWRTEVLPGEVSGDTDR